MAEFLHAGLINGVVDGGAAAGAGADDLVAQQTGIGGKRLNHLRLIVKSHHECFVFAVAHHAEEEIISSVLLKLDAVADAVGCVEQHADAQRQVGLPAEITNILGNVVVEDFEILLFEGQEQACCGGRAR